MVAIVTFSWTSLPHLYLLWYAASNSCHWDICLNVFHFFLVSSGLPPSIITAETFTWTFSISFLSVLSSCLRRLLLRRLSECFSTPSYPFWHSAYCWEIRLNVFYFSSFSLVCFDIPWRLPLARLPECFHFYTFCFDIPPPMLGHLYNIPQTLHLNICHWDVRPRWSLFLISYSPSSNFMTVERPSLSRWPDPLVSYILISAEVFLKNQGFVCLPIGHWFQILGSKLSWFWTIIYTVYLYV